MAGNGRFVRNVIEAAEEEREYRLSQTYGALLEGLDEQQLMRIDLADMKAALRGVVGTLVCSRDGYSAIPVLGRCTVG